MLANARKGSLRNEYIDARQGRTTVVEIYEEWEPTTSVSDKTRYTRKSTWKNHLLDKWGDRPVSTIKDVEVQAWVAEEFRSGTSRAVLQQALALFRLLLGYAVKTGRTMSNAASGAKLPPKQPSDRCFCQRSLKSSPKRSSKSSPPGKDWMGDFIGGMGADPIPAWAGSVIEEDRGRSGLCEEDGGEGFGFRFAALLQATGCQRHEFRSV